MSNVSRRDFLKSAGVMALAVAAAGVLSGCDGSSSPVMKDVKVVYRRWNNLLDKWVDVSYTEGEYDEVVSVVKGGKVKKEQLKNLDAILTNTGYKLPDDATEFEVEWKVETPIAEIHMVQNS